MTRDSVGFNFLLAAVLSNLSKSHSSNILQTGDNFESIGVNRIGSNTLAEDAKALLALVETGLV